MPSKSDKHINPFIHNLSIPTIEYVRSFKSVEGQLVKDSFEVDARNHARLYTSRVARELIFKALSIYARDMILAMLYFTNKDYKYVILTYEKMLDLYNNGTYEKYNRRRFDVTIRELISYHILDYKCKTRGEFWFNPIYYSPSNAIKLFPECVLKVRTVVLSQRSDTLTDIPTNVITDGQTG